MIVALTVPGATADASSPWLPPQTVGALAGVPRVAVDAAGDASVAGAAGAVLVAERRAGSAWSAAVPIYTPSAGETVGGADVASDRAGDVAAVWVDTVGSASVVMAAFRPAGGSWSPPATISASGASNPRVLLDDAGNATAVWLQSASGTLGPTVLAGARPAGGAWSAPADAQDLATPLCCYDIADELDVAVNAAGKVVAVWHAYVTAPTPQGFILAAVRPPGSSVWTGGQVAVVGGGATEFPHVAVDPQGDVFAVFESDAHPPQEIGASILRASVAKWQGPLTVATEPSGEIYDPRVAVDASGNAIAAWHTETSQHSAQVAELPSGSSTWGARQTLSMPGINAWSPELAFSPNAGFVAAWIENDGGRVSLHGASLPQGGLWSSSQDLSVLQPGQSAGFPSIALDSSGDGLVAWSLSGASSSLVRATPYDAAGPRLLGLAVPGSAVVGVPVGVAVSPFDAWSSIGAIGWDFGDGATATGASATHAYSTPGLRTVAVTALDAVGNATAATRPIDVQAAPLPEVRITKAVFHMKWRESVAVGTLAVAGTASQDATLRISLNASSSKAAGQRAAVSVKPLRVTAGAWKTTLKLRTSRPGGYTVSIVGTNVNGRGLVTKQTAKLQAPPQGIASAAWGSASVHGPHTLALAGTFKRLYATFKLTVLPKAKLRLTTTWYRPGGKLLHAPLAKPRASTVVSFLDGAGKTLSPGVWRCVLRAGNLVVKSLRVRISA